MTVPLTLSSVPAVTPYIQYVATNGQTVFPYPFPITQDADLICVINGVTQATDSGYTLSGQGNATGGNLTFTLGRTTGDVVTLFRDVTIERLTQIGQNSGFSSTAFNAEFNNIYLILQQLQESILLSLQIPNTNSPAPIPTLTPSAYANKYLSFDANGNPTPAALTSSGVLTQAIVGALTQGQTALEVTAGIAPNTLYPAGDVRRYGADPTGVSDSSTAWSNACKCNSEVYDGHPGGGTYLFNSSVTLTNYPVTIRGCTRWPDAASVLNGTKLILATAAGASAAHFKIPGIAHGINIRDIGFTWQTYTTGQAAILASNDLRYCVIERCAFFGAVVANNSVRAIQFQTAAVFTGDVVIRDNFFDAIYAGVVLTGACTTVKIYGNEFYGYAGVNAIASFGAITGGTGYTNGTYNNVPLTGGTGTGATAQIVVAGGAVTAVTLITGGGNFTAADAISASTANIGPGTGFSVPAATVGNKFGIAVQCNYPTTEPLISFNYFEGFTTGIYSNGSAYLKLIGNDYGPNFNHWTWVKTTFARIWNQSIGETFAGAGVINYPQNNIDLCQVLSGPGTYYLDNATMGTGLGFIEQQRTVANGHWQTRAFAAGNFTASGAMTWTVIAGNVGVETWEIDGNAVTYNLHLIGSTAGGVAGTTLKIALPFTPHDTIAGPCIVQNNGVLSVGSWLVNANVASLSIFIDATQTANWTLSANTGAKLSIRFQINSSVP